MTGRGSSDTDAPRVVKGTQDFKLDRASFRARVLEHFYDPAFDAVRDQLDDIIDVAWDGYDEYRKSPRTRAAGQEFAEPDFELPIEWLETRQRILAAEARQSDPSSPSRILVINGSARTDQTCPGEVSKTWRLAGLAQRLIESISGFEVDFLDLSALTAEYGRVIYPCKACVSTAMPLCHWPCSCYPNHAMGQSGDWMHEIYERWTAAHGIMILAPVNWYQAPSVLKLMIDRLVCADGGNPDPTTTHGKTPELAKGLELAGWPFPRHLAGRVFSVVVHGDSAGVENLRRMLTDWLTDMELVPASPHASLDRYIGYFEPYATSHDALDSDPDLLEEVEHAAGMLVEAVRLRREGKLPDPASGFQNPRPK